jgi:uncharacterized protein (TIGR02246 family)
MSRQLTASVVRPVERYFEALNEHDLDAVVELFTEDAVVMASEAPTAAGREEVRGAYTHGFAVMEFGRVPEIDETITEGDLAVVRCHTTGTFTLKATGMRIEAICRELFALKRAAGEWKIHSYMFNSPTPAQQ